MRPKPPTAHTVIGRRQLALVGRPADDVESDLTDLGLRVKRVSSSDQTTTLEYDPWQVRLILDDDTEKVLRYICG